MIVSPEAGLEMVLLGFLALILTTNVLNVLSCDQNGVVSNCTFGKRTLHEFHDKLLVGTGKINFMRSKDQIVVVTNIASF